MTVVNPTHTAGIRLIHKIRAEHLQTSAVCIVKIFLWTTLASTAPRPAILQIGLADIYFFSAVTSTMPYMETIFFSCIRKDGQPPKTFSNPILQRRFFPASTAPSVPRNQSSFRCLNSISTVTLTEPQRIPVFRFLPGFSKNRQFSKPEPSQVLHSVIGGFFTAAAVDHSRL